MGCENHVLVISSHPGSLHIHPTGFRVCIDIGLSSPSSLTLASILTMPERQTWHLGRLTMILRAVGRLSLFGYIGVFNVPMDPPPRHDLCQFHSGWVRGRFRCIGGTGYRQRPLKLHLQRSDPTRKSECKSGRRAVMLPLPSLTGASLLDYFGMAIGLSLGFAVLQTPMKQIEDAIRSK